ncbi:MAG TPA: hypothetical protein VGF56_03565 [Rhizomicrobium sp.]|jgi:hypothetical protein
MVAVRRVTLVILVLLGPAVATFLVIAMGYALILALNRVIDPFYVELAAVMFYGALIFGAFLEAKTRW